MAAAYQGRHAGAASAVMPAAGKPGRQKSTVRGRSLNFRRPLASAAVMLAVAGVSAAGSSEALPFPIGPSFVASPLAVAQASALSQTSQDTNVSLSAARRSGVQRASALTHDQKAAADALIVTRARAAADMVQARIVAAAAVARAKTRQRLVDRAQTDPKSVAELLALDHGWGAGQFSCLDNLWTKESGWRWNASNGSSGAYGIPQSLPGSKMSSAGSDWATNPVTQIKWGLGYIAGRYGTPCGAWSQSQAVNWY